MPGTQEDSSELQTPQDIIKAAIEEIKELIQYGISLRRAQDIFLKKVAKENISTENLININDIKDVVLLAVEENGLNLEFASENLRNDKDIVVAAVNQNGRSLEYASDHLKQDREIVWAAEMEKYRLEEDSRGFCYGLSLTMAYMESVGKGDWWEGMLKKVIECGKKTSVIDKDSTGINQGLIIKVMNEYTYHIQSGGPHLSTSRGVKLSDIYATRIPYCPSEHKEDYSESFMPFGTTPLKNAMEYTYSTLLERVTSYIRLHQGRDKAYEGERFEHFIVDPKELIDQYYLKSGMVKRTGFYGYFGDQDLLDIFTVMEGQPNNGIGIVLAFPSHACSIIVEKVSDKVMFSIYDPNDDQSALFSKEDFVKTLRDKERYYHTIKGINTEHPFISIRFYANEEYLENCTPEEKQENTDFFDNIEKCYQQTDLLRNMPSQDKDIDNDMHFDTLSHECFNHPKLADKDYIASKIIENPFFYQCAFTTLKNSEEIIQLVMQTLKDQHLWLIDTIFENGSDEIRDNEDLVMLALSKNGLVYEYVSERLKNQKDVLLAAIEIGYPLSYKKNFSLMQHAPKILRQQKDVIMAAIQEDKSALEYASKNLKNDKEVVLAAIENGGPSSRKNAFPLIQFASLNLRNDKDVMMRAINVDPNSIKFASTALRNDSDIIDAAVTQDGLLLRFASEDLRKNQIIIDIACMQNSDAIEYSLITTAKSDAGAIADESKFNSASPTPSNIKQPKSRLSFFDNKPCNTTKVDHKEVSEGKSSFKKR